MFKKRKETKGIKGREGGRKTKPRGTDINFGKVAPKTLMLVFNTSQNLLSLVKKHFPSKQYRNTKFNTTKKKYKCNHGAVV